MDSNGTIIKTNEKGIAAVYLALILVMLVALAGIVVDFSYMYIAKGQLQNAADAAALAGTARLNGSAFTNQTGARNEAWRFAYNNKMVPAGKSVFLIASSNYASPPSNLNNSNDVDGDIVLGHWYGPGDFRPRNEGGTLIPLPPGDIINAVKVVARRTSDTPSPNVRIGNNPMSTFLGRVIGWNQMNVAAEAIASVTEGPILPIAVNEYWLQRDAAMRPYPDPVHEYPSSFVRKTNVDGSSSLAFGKIFAILGSNANDNIPTSMTPGAANMNGFVNMDSRSFNHDGSGVSWYDVITGTTMVTDCSNCSGGFVGPITKNSGSISSVKFDQNFDYLLNGYPENLILPTAVKEVYRSAYPTANYVMPTSSCPFATIAYFSSSGNQPLNKKDASGRTFSDVFPIGEKVVTMVYDGTFKPDTDPSMPNAITILGYVPLQIDGYSDTNPKHLLTKNFFGTSGSSVYAHALDAMIEPASSFGICDTSFFDRLRVLRFKAGKIKLVK